MSVLNASVNTDAGEVDHLSYTLGEGVCESDVTDVQIRSIGEPPGRTRVLVVAATHIDTGDIGLVASLVPAVEDIDVQRGTEGTDAHQRAVGAVVLLAADTVGQQDGEFETLVPEGV